MEGALPLGAIRGIDFPAMHFKLAEGDALMLMSDGIAEAQDAGGSLFGFERIGEMLRSSASAAAIATAAQAFGQEDDITVLSLSFVGVPASA
jgi:serine phosphatase RsbU (regulator of sigma subunit)